MICVLMGASILSIMPPEKLIMYAKNAKSETTINHATTATFAARRRTQMLHEARLRRVFSSRRSNRPLRQATKKEVCWIVTWICHATIISLLSIADMTVSLGVKIVSNRKAFNHMNTSKIIAHNTGSLFENNSRPSEPARAERFFPAVFGVTPPNGHLKYCPHTCMLRRSGDKMSLKGSSYSSLPRSKWTCCYRHTAARVSQNYNAYTKTSYSSLCCVPRILSTPSATSIVLAMNKSLLGLIEVVLFTRFISMAGRTGWTVTIVSFVGVDDAVAAVLLQ